MALGRCTTIPRAFSYILPIQSLVTGVVIYGTVYTFPPPFSTPFILAVVATGLQFFLGLYCCFLGAKAGLYHRFLIPTWLILLAGIWGGPLYYLTRALESELALKLLLGAQYAKTFSDADARIIWRSVGVAGSAVNCFIDLILLAVFIVIGMRRPHPVGFNPNPVSAPPTSYGHIQQQQYLPAVATATTFPPMSPATYSQEPALAGQTQQVYGQPSPLGSNPSTVAFPLYQQQQAHQAAQIVPSPSPAASADGKPPPTVSTVSYGNGNGHGPGNFNANANTNAEATGNADGFDSQNRIELLRRLLSLQAADGHWEWSSELHDILRICGRELTDSSPLAVTSMASSLAVDICQYVWGAQRERREHTALTAAEMMSLQGMNWDLSWAQRCTDNAAVWMSGGFR